MAISSPRLRGLIFLGAVVLLWAAVTEGGLVNPLLLPSPIDVGRALGTLFAHAGFASDFFLTAGRAGIVLFDFCLPISAGWG